MLCTMKAADFLLSVNNMMETLGGIEGSGSFTSCFIFLAIRVFDRHSLDTRDFFFFYFDSKYIYREGMNIWETKGMRQKRTGFC